MNNIAEYKNILSKDSGSNNLIKYSLLDRINEIRACLKNGYWMSAASLTLTLPDICGQVEFGKESRSNKHYIRWILKYVNDKGIYPKTDDKGNMSFYDAFTPEIFYQLRCSVIHDGSTLLNPYKINKYAFVSHEDFIHKYKIDFSISECREKSNFIRGMGSSADLNKKEEIINVTVNINAFCQYVCDQAEKHYYSFKRKYDSSTITFLDYY